MALLCPLKRVLSIYPDITINWASPLSREWRAGLSSPLPDERSCMSSREEILARVRANLGVVAGDDGRRSNARTSLLARQYGPRPLVDGDLATRFAAKSAAMSSTVETVADADAVPAAVAHYLIGQGLPLHAVCWPELATLDWPSSGVAVTARAANGDDPVGITGCFCAIAETGTLMLVSGPKTAATTSLLPETHIAVVPVSRIVPAMEEAFALLRAECRQSGDDLPRAVNLVSGPSRTGDIEQTIVLGAHGPYRVHLILVEGRPAPDSVR